MIMLVSGLVVGALLALSGCGESDSSDGGEPKSDVPAKVADVKSLKYSDVQPILKAHCVPCHAEVGGYAGVSLDSYDFVQNNMVRAVNCIEGNCPTTETKRMPPGRARWSETDKAKLLGWLKEGGKK
jgi:hypothetical protein